jgi:hypothetical protein
MLAAPYGAFKRAPRTRGPGYPRPRCPGST